MDRCTSRLHHVCQGEYLAMHEIDIDGADQNICHDCVDKLCMGCKPDKLNNMGYSTLYRTEEF